MSTSGSTGLCRAAAMIIVAVFAVGCTGVEDPAPSPPAGTGAAPSSTATSTASDEVWDRARDGAEVTVVESAVSNTEDAAGRMASYAVIVENPSSDVAFIVRMTITLLDADGKPVADRVVEREQVESAVNLVLPGERQALTNTTYVDRPVDRIKITIRDTHWIADDGRAVALTPTDVSHRRTGDKLTVTFRAESEYDEEIQPVATYAVFRDAEGTLLGGTWYNDAEPHSYLPGRNDGEIEVSGGMPSGWKSVEVYLDPYLGSYL